MLMEKLGISLDEDDDEENRRHHATAERALILSYFTETGGTASKPA